MKINKIGLFSVVLLLCCGGISAKTNLILFGKGTFNQARSEDYRPGIADFSETAAFSTFGAGIGMTTGSRNTFFGFEFHYNPAGSVELRDPSDGDTVTIDSYPAAMAFLTLGVNIVRSSRLRLFLQAGGGLGYAVNMNTKTYTSTLGYETIIDPPDKKYSFGGFGGLGAVFDIASGFGIFLSTRYQLMGTEGTASAVAVLAGISLDI